MLQFICVVAALFFVGQNLSHSAPASRQAAVIIPDAEAVNMTELVGLAKNNDLSSQQRAEAAFRIAQICKGGFDPAEMVNYFVLASNMGHPQAIPAFVQEMGKTQGDDQKLVRDSLSKLSPEALGQVIAATSAAGATAAKKLVLDMVAEQGKPFSQSNPRAVFVLYLATRQADAEVSSAAVQAMSKAFTPAVGEGLSTWLKTAPADVTTAATALAEAVGKGDATAQEVSSLALADNSPATPHAEKLLAALLERSASTPPSLALILSAIEKKQLGKERLLLAVADAKNPAPSLEEIALAAWAEENPRMKSAALAVFYRPSMANHPIAQSARRDADASEHSNIRAEHHLRSAIASWNNPELSAWHANLSRSLGHPRATDKILSASTSSTPAALAAWFSAACDYPNLIQDIIKASSNPDLLPIIQQGIASAAPKVLSGSPGASSLTASALTHEALTDAAVTALDTAESGAGTAAKKLFAPGGDTAPLLTELADQAVTGHKGALTALSVAASSGNSTLSHQAAEALCKTAVSQELALSVVSAMVKKGTVAQRSIFTTATGRVLAISRHPALAQLVVVASSDSDPVVRAASVLGLTAPSMLDDTEAANARGSLSGDEHAMVKSALAFSAAERLASAEIASPEWAERVRFLGQATVLEHGQAGAALLQTLLQSPADKMSETLLLLSESPSALGAALGTATATQEEALAPICTALGTLSEAAKKDMAVMRLLCSATGKGSPNTLEAARQALSAAFGADQGKALEIIYQAEPSRVVEAVAATAENVRKNVPGAAEALRIACMDSDTAIRSAALEWMGALAGVSPSALKLIEQMASDTNPEVRLNTIHALSSGATRKNELLQVLLKAAKDPEPAVRQMAVTALSASVVRRNAAATKALVDAAQDQDPSVRVAAVHGLGSAITAGNAAAKSAVESLASSPDPAVASAAQAFLANAQKK